MTQENWVLSGLTLKAASFAEEAHKDQKRKYTDEPYFNHCAEVANLVKQVGGSEVQIAAAFLHDTVEDCNVTLLEIARLFGVEVCRLVENLTDVSQPNDGNRRIRKEKDRMHTACASPEAKTIKLADLISNSRTIVPLDPDFAKVYMAEKKRLLAVLKEGDATLYARAEQILIDYEKGRVQEKLKEMDSHA
jgi:(p)ppGpp synthase/HD superfamily hydrolase